MCSSSATHSTDKAGTTLGSSFVNIRAWAEHLGNLKQTPLRTRQRVQNAPTDFTGEVKNTEMLGLPLEFPPNTNHKNSLLITSHLGMNLIQGPLDIV